LKRNSYVCDHKHFAQIKHTRQLTFRTKKSSKDSNLVKEKYFYQIYLYTVLDIVALKNDKKRSITQLSNYLLISKLTNQLTH